MLTKIQKWGNSQGVRLAKNILADVGLNVGDEVQISVKNKAITLEDLVARIPKDYQPSEIDWGEPIGKEVW
ncbi:MAG: AbrB/MazE/SpoVT family DNA-binding domain-containing protein [Deltaproteobacteria bacterium]|nr:AbrB/MazE/SpoVT family DNA-binding domain-containing protein [Deltaproteobacteria bacterium]